ncbi:MAG: ABC transporter permease, partial [Alphaproteobacteria bacterium]|nr:ABC transporter permease [Alphaproteobacteria bacterium]
MSIFQLIGTFELGLIYALVGMGAYISFRVLNFPDMTVDGSYVLGAAVYAAGVANFNLHPVMATLLAMGAGVCAGACTALLSTRLKMLNLLAGILIMTALYSINLRIMGRPNLALLDHDSLFSLWFPGMAKVVPLALIVGIVVLLLWLFLNTSLGLCLRATGNNPRMCRAQGVNDKTMIVIGICLSNLLVSLAGALYAQYSGFSDINLGIGTIVTGLAALIIGEAIFPHAKVFHALLACIGGAIIFYMVTALALNSHSLGLQTSDQKLITALFMCGAMGLPKLKK